MTFDSVLIANRGEIARRVIRACRSGGLRSIAVYSDADRASLHVRDADEAVRIGPPIAALSYLSIPALLAAAARTGAQAVHPGYGFLSERAEFARAVTEAGLVFIGPPADVMDAMGRKDHARRIAIEAGVPVLPAVELSSDPPADPEVDAARIGYPLLAKAAAGGGGKGMRIVRSAPDLAPALAGARREAGAAFGDDTMLLERYVEHGRHIEAQILADTYGSVIHLFERDCSVQRRHQKVIEEAPAVSISDRARSIVLESAVALARRVGYVNAGTVEFLVNGEEVFFLEMNTRLQVEHPVTEAITGLDLVALQISVAQGEPLPVAQSDVVVRGHAIEARVYAEDAYRGFIPQAGVADLVRYPPDARVEHAMHEGQEVTTWYDPMLAKIVVAGASREVARRRLVAALDRTAIVGLTTNVGFLRDVAASPAYRGLEIDTSWLDTHDMPVPVGPPDEAWILAAWRAASQGTDVGDPLAQRDGWRLGGPPSPCRLTLVSGENANEVVVDRVEGSVTIAGRRVRVVPVGDADILELEIDGNLVVGVVHRLTSTIRVTFHGKTYEFEQPDVFGVHAHHDVADGSVSAPMPGTILSVEVVAGSKVAAAAILGVMEAMKMEVTLRAPFDGVVAETKTTPGATVRLGDELFRVEPV